MTDLPLFSVRLRELRDAAKMTQHELADRASIHRQTIAQLETGVRKPSWDTVQALATALGVDCSAFQSSPPPAAEPEKKLRKRKERE
jgi:transcriptional regulator with XRE-family HTH domain